VDSGSRKENASNKQNGASVLMDQNQGSRKKRRRTMWYFAWILGLGLAATVGILNALWYELRTVREKDESAPTLRTP
jgi:cytochrome bd-I ubiquinol oxidase subunit X